MDYVDVEKARGLPGLRLVLSVGVPGPWGEAAKGILHAKGIAYTPVAQLPAMPNPALVEWTGHGNAPIAVLDDEQPRTGWAEILWLAERLAPEPALVPRDPAARVLMYGLAHEICGEMGLGWCRRLMIVDKMSGQAGASAAQRGPGDRLARRYGYSASAAEGAPARVAEILRLLAVQLSTQRAAGSRYFIGTTLTALDIYWATFAALIRPLPADLCPMNDMVRSWYAATGPVVDAAIDPTLIEHRDFIYRSHLRLPLDF